MIPPTSSHQINIIFLNIGAGNTTINTSCNYLIMMKNSTIMATLVKLCQGSVTSISSEGYCILKYSRGNIYTIFTI